MKADQSMEMFCISKPRRRTGMPSKLAMSKSQDITPMCEAHRGLEKGSPRKLQGCKAFVSQ